MATQLMLAFAKLHGSGGCRGDDGGPDRSFCSTWLLPDECGPFAATRATGKRKVDAHAAQPRVDQAIPRTAFA
jgi:hypothetical protein